MTDPARGTTAQPDPVSDRPGSVLQPAPGSQRLQPRHDQGGSCLGKLLEVIKAVVRQIGDQVASTKRSIPCPKPFVERRVVLREIFRFRKQTGGYRACCNATLTDDLRDT